MTDWQPITTAPMLSLKAPKVDLWVERPDGTGYRVPDAFWSGSPNGFWKIATMVGFEIRAFRETHNPTHWMRRPVAPEPLS